MKQLATLLVLLTSFLTAITVADEQPAKGMLLVATEQIQGPVFSQTVILLLQYNEDGAMGLIVNRPTDIAPSEVAADTEAFDDYDDPLYFGGPVHVGAVHVLMRTDTPPDGAERIVGSVYVVGVEAGLERAGSGEDSVRFYMGFAGWGPGQLDQEIARGSWQILPASHEHVFAEDSAGLWERLNTPTEYRAALR